MERREEGGKGGRDAEQLALLGSPDATSDWTDEAVLPASSLSPSDNKRLARLLLSSGRARGGAAGSRARQSAPRQEISQILPTHRQRQEFST